MEQKIMTIAIYGPWILNDKAGTLANDPQSETVVFEGTKDDIFKMVKHLIRISRSATANRQGWERKAARTLLGAIWYKNNS